MNKCVFIGNLTRDPELATTQSGLSVCRFTIAVSRKVKVDGHPSADFIPVVTWRALADNYSKYLHKGNKCAVVGALQIRSYEDDTGTTRTIAEVMAEEVEFLVTSKNENEQSKDADKSQLNEVSNDDIPF